MESPIKTLNIARNRSQRRRLAPEVSQNHNLLSDVERSFLHELFFEPDISYVSSYVRHLDRFRKSIEMMKAKGMFKFTHPDIHYFSDKYKPLENRSRCRVIPR